MTTLIIHWDRCGERIERGRAKLLLECGPTAPTWNIDTATGRPAIDLCGLCLDALTAWARSGRAPSGEMGVMS